MLISSKAWSWESFSVCLARSTEVLILSSKSNALVGSCANLDRNSAGNLSWQPMTPVLGEHSVLAAGALPALCWNGCVPGGSLQPLGRRRRQQRWLLCSQTYPWVVPRAQWLQAKFQFITQALKCLQVFHFWVAAHSEGAAGVESPALPLRCSCKVRWGNCSEDLMWSEACQPACGASGLQSVC